MLRVALVAPFGLRPKGTTSARVLPIARVLAAQGAEVRVIVPPWDDPDRAGERCVWGSGAPAWGSGVGGRGPGLGTGLTPDPLSNSRPPSVVQIVHTRLGLMPVRPGLIFWDMLRELRAFQPDVVHAFKPIGYSGAIARRLAGNGAGPLVVVDTDDLEGPPGWSGRRGLGLGGLVRGAQERRTLRAAPSVTVASAWLADFAARLGVPAERQLRLPNGHGIVPSPEFRVPSQNEVVPSPESRVPSPNERVPSPESRVPSRDRDGADDWRLGTEDLIVETDDSGLGTRDARLVWYTRFTEAAPARAARLLAPLLRARPELRLTILGDELGAGDRYAMEMALVGEGVGPQVVWVGYEQASADDLLLGVARDAVAVYPLDDDVVNRARCPSKVPQLMALRVPIVAESVGEVGRYLAGFEGSCLVQPGDEEGFRRRVMALIDDREERTRLGERLQGAAEEWRWDRVAAGLLRWYGEALFARGSGVGGRGSG